MKLYRKHAYHFLIIAGCLLIQHELLAHGTVRKQKSQGLLTQSVDQKHDHPAVDSLSTLPAPIDLSTELDSLDDKQPVMRLAQTNARHAVGFDQEASIKNATAPIMASKETSNIPSSKPKKEKPQKTESIKPIKTQTFDIPEDDIPSIEFHFENTDLQNLVTQVSEIFNVSFIPDDAIEPLAPNAKTLKGNKISFKTQKPLTRKDAWSLFLTFLDLAGLSVVPQADPKTFRITSTEAAQRSSIRSFIGVDPNLLPDNDEVIRYVYFIENSTIDAIRGIVDSLRSSTAPLQILQESKAFILTDKAYNIKVLMQIVKELDKVTMPQTLSVLKLKRTDAKQVKDLYDAIRGGQDDSIAARLFPARKQPTSLYFPENTRIFAEPRTNTLILLGPKDAIAKIEDFIVKYVDVELDKPFSPLHVYPLKYADAETVAQIMTSVTEFGKNTPAGQAGGVRGEDKYLRQMNFIAEKETNRLIIRGDYDDYLRVVEIIKKLDEPQPQVAMEVLILSLSINDIKQLGTQLRSAVPGIDGLVGPNVKYQTSGLFAGGTTGQGIVENPNGPGVTRLLGNLINLVVNKAAGTVITLGDDAFGVWGVFQVLDSLVNTQVISNPFITAINKTPAIVSLGETIRIVTGTVIGGSTPQQAFGDDQANLTVKITPQINSDGMIILDLVVDIVEFTDTSPTTAVKRIRNVTTKTVVADKEVLALGGIIQNSLVDSTNKTPLLGDIPILGWLFKNKSKIKRDDNLLILISTRIIPPENTAFTESFTNERIKGYQKDLAMIEQPLKNKDPINKWFFKDSPKNITTVMNDFMFQGSNPDVISGKYFENKNVRRKRNRREARKQKKEAREKKQQTLQALLKGQSKGVVA